MDTSMQRAGSAIVAGFMLILAIGLASPSRFFWALRIASAIVAAAFAFYFVFEMISLMRGKPQHLAIGSPSAAMAAVGLIVFGIPAFVFAVGVERVGLARLFGSSSRNGRSDSDSRSNTR